MAEVCRACGCEQFDGDEHMLVSNGDGTNPRTMLVTCRMFRGTHKMMFCSSVPIEQGRLHFSKPFNPQIWGYPSDTDAQ